MVLLCVLAIHPKITFSHLTLVILRSRSQGCTCYRDTIFGVELLTAFLVTKIGRTLLRKPPFLPPHARTHARWARTLRTHTSHAHRVRKLRTHAAHRARKLRTHIWKRKIFSMSRIFGEKRSKPWNFLAYYSKSPYFSIIVWLGRLGNHFLLVSTLNIKLLL